ncbi:unnamed protein product [Cercospora beticola]|nr:unnamed protein product [Cercospora beticola]
MSYGATQAEPVRPLPLHHERYGSHASEHLPYPPPPRPNVELPRPLEPRPPVSQQRYYDAPQGQRRPDAFRSPASSNQEFRPQSQNLPRLHDILTSTAPPAPSPTSYSSNWGSSTAPTPPPNHPNGDSRYSHGPWYTHAPPPPQEQPSYQPPPARRLDMPVSNTSPVSRHDSHTGPISPYGPHPESRGYELAQRERPRQPSTSSYTHNGAPSPYIPNGSEEHHYRNGAVHINRPGSSNYGPAGPECSKKYLGIRELPGEGTFHLYEGGLRIPTHVDGEQVNPAWGLTKANKPRKRLAMACLDCREKKIKCEPGAASCLQCEKAKRPCRKAPSHQSQPDASSPSIWPTNTASPPGKSVSGFSPLNRQDTEQEAISKRRPLEDHSPSGAPAKKHRSMSPVYSANGGFGAPLAAAHPLTSPAIPRSPTTGLSCDVDPYAAHPEATLQVLDHFFQDVNNATYCMFPRHHFMHWLQSCSQKFQNEKLLLYAMLAIGSIFAEDAHAGFGEQCARVAAASLQATQGSYTLPIVQSRLLLGLYHSAKGTHAAGWDYTGAGIDAAIYLRYNTEQGCIEADTSGKTRNDFGLSNEQLAECKRRTLWSAFLMERYRGGRSTLINPQDIFLRLPCLDDSFERGLASEAPYYDNGIIDPAKASLTHSSPTSPMAWLCLIGAIWGDVSNFIYRAMHRSPQTYQQEYDRFYDHISAALQNWYSRLPDQLRFSKVNVDRSIKGSYAGPYISMHILYHLAWVKMNRFVRHALVPQVITRNIRAAHHHSHELLQVISTLRAAKWDMAEKDGHIASFSFTTAFAGYAILAAIDVVGAGGLDTHLKATLDLISCGLECLRELARYWDSARDQDKACEKRYYQIHNVLKHPFTARSGCWLGREWGVHTPLEQEISQEDDCIYGADDRLYFDALRDDSANGRAPSAGQRPVGGP